MDTFIEQGQIWKDSKGSLYLVKWVATLPPAGSKRCQTAGIINVETRKEKTVTTDELSWWALWIGRETSL